MYGIVFRKKCKFKLFCCNSHRKVNLILQAERKSGSNTCSTTTSTYSTASAAAVESFVSLDDYFFDWIDFKIDLTIMNSVILIV